MVFHAPSTRAVAFSGGIAQAWVVPRELEKEAVRLVAELLGADLGTTPGWLVRPGRSECRSRWDLVTGLYDRLTGMTLPDAMPPREWRAVDAVLLVPDHPPRIFEFDETLHFSRFRAETLATYAAEVALAFPPDVWVARGEAKTRLEGGGFGKPRPPLFPGEGGRHKQRAFRDALCDLLPDVHGFAPTLRIADFEVRHWLFTSGARELMSALLAKRLHPNAPSDVQIEQPKPDPVLRGHTPGTTTSLADLLATLPAPPDPEQQRVIAAAVTGLRPDDPQLVERVASISGFDGDAAAVAQALRLNVLTGGHLPLIKALQARLQHSSDTDGSLRPLAALTPDDWLDLVYTHGTPDGQAISPAAYADALSASIKQQHPHQPAQ